MIDFNSFFKENFAEKDYEKYMQTWLNGIVDEIWFWDTYIAREGWIWKKGFKDTISYERKFALESYLDAECENTILLDVGSGPFSTCGSQTEVTNLELHAVDPLAAVYKNIKKRYGIRTKIQPEFAMVERLNEKYDTNTFDIVHMRNALDHSFNPVLGLLQLLRVCKIGGKVILCHRDNEAAYERYVGFHQWNLQVEGENSFYIWRGNKKFDVSELFGDMITLKATPAKNREELHEVIITKVGVGEIETVVDSFLEIYHRKTFNKLLECLTDEFYKNKEKEASKIYQYRKKIELLKQKLFI